ncbi:hypothetical protein [Pseudomonas capeferrum]
MSTYYHEVDTLAFQHQIASISKEMKFRISELISASQVELAAFYHSIQNGTSNGGGGTQVFQYRFSSLLALLQTFRDALPHAVGADIDMSPLSFDIPHTALMFQLRNSYVHDGYQPVGLWVDGRYYFPVNFIRRDQKNKIIKVNVSTLDVETLALEYSEVYCRRLAELLESLPSSKKLQKVSYFTKEWFQAALQHPAMQKLKGVIEPPSFSGLPTGPASLDLAAVELRGISQLCTERLQELKTLPDIPFR